MSSPLAKCRLLIGLLLLSATLPAFGQSTSDDASAVADPNVEEVWMANNATKEGVVSTVSGLQYEVLKMGDGPKANLLSTVRVHYKGELTNGMVFDSSYDRGEAMKAPLANLIEGWQEGIPLMPVGSKFRFFIPSKLGYGERAVHTIPAYSTLIFEVELLEIIEITKP